MVFNAPQGLTSFLSTLISCPIHSTHYYNNSKTHYICSFLCLFFCLLPEPGMLFPLWKPAWLIVQDSDQMPAFLPQSCQLQFFLKFCSIFLLHISVSDLAFPLPIPSRCQGLPVNCYLSEVCAPTRKPISGFSCSRKANMKQVEILNFFCATNTLAQTGEFHRSLSSYVLKFIQ